AVLYSSANRSDRSLELTTALVGQDGEPYAIRMAWDPARARFVGHAPTRVRLGTGPVDLLVKGVDGAYRGGIGTATALPRTSPGIQPLIAGPYIVELLMRPGHVIWARVLDRYGQTAPY